MDCEALRAEVQKLKDTLEETKEQLKLAGEIGLAPPHFQPCLHKEPHPRSYSTPPDFIFIPAVPSSLLSLQTHSLSEANSLLLPAFPQPP